MGERDGRRWEITRLGLLVQALGMVGLAAVLFGLVPGGRLIGGGWLPKVLYLSRMVALIALATRLLHRRGLGWADLGLRRPRVWRLIACVVVGLIATFAALALVGLALRQAGVASANYSRFAPVRGSLAEYLFWAVPVAMGSAALGEELIFRGFVRDALQRALGPDSRMALVAAILIQAALFGAMHAYQGLGGVASTATIGLCFGLIWWANGRNLWAGVILHGLFDVSAMTVIFLNGVPAAP